MAIASARKRSNSRFAGHSVATSSFSRKTYAHHLFVVACEDVFIRKGRMRPAHAAALRQLTGRRLEQFRAADLVIATGREARDNQIAALIEEEVTIAVLH